MTLKTPTAPAISALLKRAGFKRSDEAARDCTSGFMVLRQPGGGVRVRHVSWSVSARPDPGPHLAEYAATITGAGYAVATENDHLIVTVKPRKD